jgi:hypothetical protein
MIANQIRRRTVNVLSGLLVLLVGCGVLTLRPPDFPNAVTGENGQIYVLEDLRAIARDLDLTEQQKRDKYHEMGIEDEDLINALLSLPA